MYVATRRSGLGDFNAPFLGGSVLTALVLGVGIIIAMKVFAPAPRGRKWAAGAWRRADYEDPHAPVFSEAEVRRLTRKRR